MRIIARIASVFITLVGLISLYQAYQYLPPAFIDWLAGWTLTFAGIGFFIYCKK
jgi:hypothetical protein